jgi:tryptophan synthase beta subunit
MGKRRIIAETGAGQHGVATATVCAKLGLECIVYMGSEDVRRQALNVYRMRLLGPRSRRRQRDEDAQGRHQRGDARLGHQRLSTFYVLGSAVGPHPYPSIVREFQAAIGREARAQVLDQIGRCRTRSWPAWAAAATRSACSPASSTTPR